MTQPQHHRPMRPAPVLPPPQAPASAYVGSAARPYVGSAAGRPAREGWPSPPPPTYQGHGYQQYPHDAGRTGHQPEWGYGGWGPPPRRRSGGLGRALLGLLGAGSALVFALVIGSAALDGGSPVATGGDAPVGASNPNASAIDPGNAAAVLEDNTLYQQGGLANGDCPAQDLGSASKQEQTVYYESLMGCLNDEWRPKVESAGYRYQDPGLVVFDTAVTTPCGQASPQDGRTLAFYCPGDSVMYADVAQMAQFFGDVDVAYAVVIGHEFGHHIQHEAGILEAEAQQVYDDFQRRLDLSRRVELQASCMSGLFLGAIAESYPIDDGRFADLERVSTGFGDEPGAPSNQRTHGSGESNREWILTAYDDNDLDVCNTFTAPEEQVD